MTNDKGIGSKTGVSLPPITEPTPTPAPTPAPAAPTPTPTAAPAAHVGRRRRRPAADHHATPAPATSAPADDETEGSEETEETPPNAAAIAAAKKELREEAAKKKEERKLKNRIKRAPKSFLAWLGKWCKKHKIFTAIIVVAIIAWATMWVNGKFFDDSSVAPSEPRLSAPKGIMPGGDDGAQRGIMANTNPTVKDDGDALTFEYADPSFPNANVTFQVITDNNLNILEVKLSDKLKEEFGGKLSIGTVDGSQEDDVRCSHTSQNCDFSDEKINLCKSWLWLNRLVPNAGGSDDQQPFWTSLQVFNATPVGTYTGSVDLPHHCGIKDSDTSS